MPKPKAGSSLCSADAGIFWINCALSWLSVRSHTSGSTRHLQGTGYLAKSPRACTKMGPQPSFERYIRSGMETQRIKDQTQGQLRYLPAYQHLKPAFRHHVRLHSSQLSMWPCALCGQSLVLTLSGHVRGKSWES